MAKVQCDTCKNFFTQRPNSMQTVCVKCRALAVAIKKGKLIRTKNCPVCCAPFTQVGKEINDRVTCSLACSYKMRADARKDQIEKVCETCGIEFKVPRSVAPTTRYCSKKCMYKRNDAKTTRECVVCAKKFRSPPSHMHVLTCSTECGYLIRNVGDKRVTIECEHCKKPFLESVCHADRRFFCSKTCEFSSERRKKEMSGNVAKEKNPQWKGGATIFVTSANGLQYGRQSPALETAKSNKRRSARLNATPAWANLGKIIEVYQISALLTKTLSIKHHVDHIVPLQSKIVCGLHCEANLQVLPAIENIKKHNRTWPDMP